MDNIHIFTPKVFDYHTMTRTDQNLNVHHKLPNSHTNVRTNRLIPSMFARTFSSLPPCWISRRNSKQKGSMRWTRHSGGTTTVTASTVNNLGTQLKGTSRAPTTLTFINKPRMDERRSEKWLVGSSRESVKEREREREKERRSVVWWYR